MFNVCNELKDERMVFYLYWISITFPPVDKISLPSDFTLVDVQAPLGHVSHPLLALLAAVHGQVVDVRGFVCHLEVTNAAVAL